MKSWQAFSGILEVFFLIDRRIKKSHPYDKLGHVMNLTSTSSTSQAKPTGNQPM